LKKNDKKIVETTLLLLKDKNWNDLSLLEIKKKSKIKKFDNLIKDKKAIIKKINEYFDFMLLIESKNIEKSNNKDMIFEILMIRFDIFQKYRKGLISIFMSFKKKPQDIFFLLPNILESIVMMIELTNISLKGIKGQLKIKGIFIIYVSSFLTWMKDDTASLEKTMITLDENLDQAGKIIALIE
jgi:hypothetical protein|tara:strand:- start:62 stop:613 length:552 start_codon:yes stop_codon:yes gene_type:complete